jgi:hypothetical protein
VVITVRSSKTDQESVGQCVGVAHGQHDVTDPVAALHAWLTVRGTTSGPVFTSLRHGHLMLRPFLGDGIAIMLAAAPVTPDSPRNGSHPTPYAPGTPPKPLSPASPSTGSPPRPDTDDSPHSSSATSGPPKHSSSPPASRDLGL